MNLGARTTSAISVDQVAAVAPHLIGRYSAARQALGEQGLIGERLQVSLILARPRMRTAWSWSEASWSLAEQVLALAAHLDGSGTVPTVFSPESPHAAPRSGGFLRVMDRANEDCAALELELTDSTQQLWQFRACLARTGSGLAQAMRQVIRRHQAGTATGPDLVIVQRWDAPTDRGDLADALSDASELPIFWRLVGSPEGAGGTTHSRPSPGEPAARVRDHASGAAPAGADAATPVALCRALVDGLSPWLADARTAGLIG